MLFLFLKFYPKLKYAVIRFFEITNKQTDQMFLYKNMDVFRLMSNFKDKYEYYCVTSNNA